VKILKGNTLEEQMKSVDTILSRQLRPMRRKAKAMITPIPISSYVDVPIENVVLKYMFPVSGTLNAGCMFIETMPKDGVDIVMEVCLGKLSRKVEQIFVKGPRISIKPNISVEAGSRLTVSVMSDEVTGIWTAFLWAPEVKDCIIKKFLTSELDGLEKE